MKKQSKAGKNKKALQITDASNNIRKMGPLWRTRPKPGGGRESYDPVTGMKITDFHWGDQQAKTKKKKRKKNA